MVSIDFAVTRDTLKALSLDVVRLEVKLSELQAENERLKSVLEEKNATIRQLEKEKRRPVEGVTAS